MYLYKDMKKEDKAQRYEELLQEVEALAGAETDEIANMANIAAAIHAKMGFHWTGFYRVCPTPDGSGEELVLGPFQGPVACTRIRYGRGVCGTAWKEARTLIVPDVEQFPGHIACSALSRSEIVIPIVRKGAVVAELDIDSAELDTFDAVDERYLTVLLTSLGSAEKS
ncbi:MAG: GAF domain-containing protein [Bacteroidales bacterium]|nr:GAF domain-containing protein [Bacteroidales bacterium]